MSYLLRTTLNLIPFGIRHRIKTIPGVAQVQRAIVSRVLDGRELDYRVDAGPARGITFHIRMPEDKGIWTGTYEIDFATRLAAAVKPGTVVYDIGSWHGFFAGVMAAHGARQVHVFEPLPANAERIRRLVALNPAKAIMLHACAVGARETEMDLMIMPETSMAKLEASSFQSGQTSTERVRVKVRALDAMVAAGEIEPPALMKIDVEGAEAMVLTGARDTIRRHQPVIFAEVHSSALLAECMALLEGEGYRVAPIDQHPVNALSNDVLQIEATPAGPS
jgi:FkbM family methyltransferase